MVRACERGRVRRRGAVEPVALRSIRSIVSGFALLATLGCGASTSFNRASTSFNREAVRSSDPVRTDELVEASPDIESRDLFYGVGGRAKAPRTDVAYRFLKRDESGMSTNFEISDPQGRVWDAKFGDEAKPEVAASRLLWAIGFYQPPVYYVREWRIEDGPEAGVQPEARFRLEKPGWKKRGEWKWKDNPFVGSRELRGLVVMMAMMNAWDLKTSNNKIYESGDRDPQRFYVVKDLGDSFGRSRRVFLGRFGSDVSDFEREQFIRRVDDDGHVQLHFKSNLLAWHVEDDVTVGDVLWTCRRLARLSDRQWRDAFRSAGYSDEQGTAFANRMKAKVREGLALASAGSDADR
jgi:hypothetical protein